MIPDEIHFHDCRIRRVVELPERGELHFEVWYPVDWSADRFEARTLAFVDAAGYAVHEGPFAGAPAILGVEADGDGVRIDTNAGYRVLRCSAVELRGGGEAPPPGIRVRPELDDGALNALFAAAWPGHAPRAFGPVLERALGWCGAFDGGRLVGFVNVAWDGGEHAFLLDPTVHPDFQWRGLGLALVRAAVQVAREGGAAWLHVDFEPHLAPFYRAAGFRDTAAGLIDLSRSRPHPAMAPR